MTQGTSRRRSLTTLALFLLAATSQLGIAQSRMIPAPRFSRISQISLILPGTCLASVSMRGRRWSCPSISGQELLREVEVAARGRSPGLNGLPYEFYLAVFPVIEVCLVEALNVMLEDGQLATSLWVGGVRLLPKVAWVPQGPIS